MKTKDFLSHIFTDAKGRPEIKTILGVPIIIVSVVFLLLKKIDIEQFKALAGFGGLLIGVTAIADGFIDHDDKGAL
jgi:hypothetical protein